jgi:hypothetical protein
MTGHAPILPHTGIMSGMPGPAGRSEVHGTGVYQARVPQAELIVRRVYGVGGAGIINRHRAGRSWAWPSGD